MKHQIRYGNCLKTLLMLCILVIDLFLSKMLVNQADLHKRTPCRYLEVTVIMLRSFKFTIINLVKIFFDL